MNVARFQRFCGIVLAVTLGVILWGAYVRASGSGAGCGSHWPSCNGEIIPRSPSIATLIEWSHRVTSGLVSLMVLAQLVWALRAFPGGHRVRAAAIWSFVLLMSEALIGAGLVLFNQVAQNASLSRAASVSAHLVNTFLLLGALTMTGFWATKPLPDPRAPRVVPWPLIFGLVGLIAVGVLGAVAALGDTLFPAQSLAEGFQGDFAPAAHLFVRVRVWHPVLAVAVALYLLIVSQLARGSGVDRSLTAKVSLLVVVQIGVGLVNLGLLAPIWTQLIHLFIADLLFIALVRLTAASLSVTPSALIAAETSAASAP